MSGCMGGYWYWLSEWKVSAPRFLHRGNRQHLFGGRVFVIVLSKGSTVLVHLYIIIHRQFLLSSLIVHCVGPIRIARISLNKRCWSTEFLTALNLKLHSKESPWRTNAPKKGVLDTCRGTRFTAASYLHGADTKFSEAVKDSIYNILVWTSS